jgi:type IV pilus assembly protein PilY1
MTKFRALFATIRLYKKIILFLVYFILALILRENPREILATADMTNYCYIPTTITQTVKPNLLIVMDFSGSMQFPAYVPCNFSGYSNQVAQCGSSTANSSSDWKYNVSKTYYGYFDPNKCYRYSASNFQEANCDCSNKVGISSCISGNLLNWVTATRIDIARWVLTGGRSSSSGGNTFLQSEGAEYVINDDNLKCKFQISASTTTNRRLTISNYNGTCPLGNNTINNANIQVRPTDPNSIKGVIHDVCDTSDLNGQINDKCKLIMEFMVFASDSRYGVIRVGKQATISALINAINSETPYWGTPTGEALWEAYDYYKQSNDHTYEANSAYINRGNANADPYYDGSGGNAIPVYCRKGFVLLISDGAWNGNVDPVVPARIMATQDLRPDLNGTQVVYTYAVYAFGDNDPSTALQGRQAMITTAIFGGFNDKDNNNWPYPFTNIQYPNGSGTCSSLEGTIRSNIQTNSITYCNSRGVVYPLPQCNPTGTWDPLCSEWDTAFGSPKDGLPYNFFEAYDAPQLKSAILSAIYDILRRASSGATVATLSQRVSTGALVLQPYFYPRYQAGDVELSWIGFLKALWVDAKGRIREDTVADKILKLLEDLWVQFVSTSSGTKIFAISNETSCTATEKNTPEQVTPLFEAGCKLADTNPGNRKVYVNKDGALVSLTDSSLTSYVQSMWNDIAGKSINATCIINYILGQDNPCPADTNTITFVSRPRTADISSLCPGSSGNRNWKLGDIYHSTPVVLSYEPLNNYHIRYGDTSYLTYINSDSYKKRTTYVFVGANDGMLHAFRVGWLSSYNPPNEPLKLTDAFSLTSTDLIGKEEWAFIPRNALPYLLWLGHKDYCHVPTVDYRVSVFDAKDPNTGQWRTYLLGMMGFGGKAISANGTTYSSSLFLLDLTDWLNGASDRPTLKWEITLPDNTLTLSYPQVVKLSNSTDWSKTYVVIGSGPKEVTGTGTPYTISFVSQFKIYFISLADGTIVKSLTIPDNNKAVGHLRTVDFDNDYVDDLIYFGTYNETSGNLYRISFKNTDGSYKDVSSLSDGDIKPVFSSYLGKPVFAALQMTFDQSRNLWVVFGTGQYLTRNYPSTNYFIGFKDTCYLGNCTLNFSDLVDRTNYCTNNSNYNATLLYNSTETTCTCTETGCSQTSEGALYQFIYSLAPNGWYHVLTVNEQMYSSVFILNYMVNALSFRPTQDICSSGGETYYWMVCLAEGCPCYSLRGETSPVVSKFIAYGASPIGQPFQPLKTEKGTTLFTQTSAGGIIQAPNPLRSTLRGKFILWIEK